MDCVELKIKEKQKTNFLLKVAPKNHNGCMEWLGSRNPKGYGQFTVGRFSARASRVAWIIEYGDLPVDKFVLHKCDNPPCVNPKHLYLGTNSDNMLDKFRRGRQGRTAQGIEKSNAKFTEQDIINIRSDPRKQVVIAKEYKVHPTAIHAIKKGRAWKHV